jgi:hypothetical protein
MVVKLNYSEVYILTTAAATLSNWYYYQTSAYDPRGSIGGHQPLYYDQMSAIYARYRVERIDFNITFMTSSAFGHTGYLAASTSTTADTGVELLEERPWVARKTFNTGGGPANLKISILPWQVLGITKQRYESDDQYSATIGANPAIMAYIWPYIYSGSSSGGVNVDTRLEAVYHIKFFELTRPASS